MKITFFIIGFFLIAFIGVQLYAMSEQKSIEQYSYKLIKAYSVFEVRQYEERLFSAVKVPTSTYKDASGRGFSILANYIFGGNDRQEQIAMTSPVAMALEDSMTIMFMVPKQYSKESLPVPNETQIDFRTEPAKTVAAITFGGWADDDRIKAHKMKLTAALDAEGIAYTERFYFLGYNPPYELVNRKNEVIVELE